MIFRKACLLFIPVFLFLVLSNVYANSETKDRHVRLLINEKTGSFSLFYLTDTEDMRYRPLFNHRNPGATFMDININKVSYRLGKTKAFVTRIERYNEDPVVVYESSLVEVRQLFTPVRTVRSPNANGIKITITVRNTSDQILSVGLRFLLDTNLSEVRNSIPFVTDNMNITKETIIENSSTEENYWLTRGRYATLMGSIKNPEGGNPSVKEPDFLHFANWKRLSDVPWKAPYHEGRNFNLMPYSINDNAVCYYYEPDDLLKGETFTYNIFLTTEDTSWYLSESDLQTLKEETEAIRKELEIAEENLQAEENTESQASTDNISKIADMDPTIDVPAIEREAIFTASETNEKFDIVILRELQSILNQFIAGEITLNERDLMEIEMSLDRYGFRE